MINVSLVLSIKCNLSCITSLVAVIHSDFHNNNLILGGLIMLNQQKIVLHLFLKCFLVT